MSVKFDKVTKKLEALHCTAITLWNVDFENGDPEKGDLIECYCITDCPIENLRLEGENAHSEEILVPFDKWVRIDTPEGQRKLKEYLNSSSARMEFVQGYKFIPIALKI